MKFDSCIIQNVFIYKIALNPRSDVPPEYKSVYETANKYHFFHSLALLAVPLTRRPLIVSNLSKFLQ